MEFNIDICNTIQGGITILDLSKEYNQYLPENSIDSSVYEDTLLFKYSDTVTVNSLLHITTKNIKYVDALIHEHIKLDNGIFKDDSCTFNILEDGYYTIDHFIFPNINWYNWYKTKASEEYKQKVNRIYIIDEGVIKKEVDGELIETTLKEVLEINLEGTPIQKEKIDTFYTGNLQQCYINYCKRIFNHLLNKCRVSTYNDDLYARDFIWMTLNIIDYLIEFGQFMDAERIIEEFNTCGGFCTGNPEHIKSHGCGCSKA